ncbi:MAG TPA: SGNH/GDSL hydrolase family protein [Mycobacteriales bacterium]|jgi:lysophospholipase L1-like esterase|nr:SGNH/GDSL hydrolase family protein [Mycobacteriales bacterium]
MGVVRRVAAGLAATTVAGGALLAVEALAVTRREFLSAETAPMVRGQFGRAFAPPLRLAVLGDSTAAGVGVSRVEDSVAGRVAQAVADTGRFVTVDGLAVSGSRAADLAPQVSRALVHPPEVALVLIGANDATHATRLTSVRADVRAAVERLRRAGVAVVVGTCPDMGSSTAFLHPLREVVAWEGRRVGAATRDAAGDAGAVTVDIGAATGAAFRRDPRRYLSSDEFHPSADGYALWADALRPAVLDAAAHFPVG